MHGNKAFPSTRTTRTFDITAAVGTTFNVYSYEAVGLIIEPITFPTCYATDAGSLSARYLFVDTNFTSLWGTRHSPYTHTAA